MDELPDVARVVPRVSPIVLNGCWILFGLALAVNLCGLAALAKLIPAAPISGAVLLVMPVSLIFSAANTYAAATGFGHRRRAILAWLKAQVASNTTNLTWRKGYATGSLAIGHGPQFEFSEREDPWQVSASGAFSPADYNTPNRTVGTKLPYTTFVGMLDSEVHRARTDAAKLAGAFAGAFVVAIQVYARLLPMLG